MTDAQAARVSEEVLLVGDSDARTARVSEEVLLVANSDGRLSRLSEEILLVANSDSRVGRISVEVLWSEATTTAKRRRIRMMGKRMRDTGFTFPHG